MLRFKDECDYAIGARHYLHTVRGLTENLNKSITGGMTAINSLLKEAPATQAMYLKPLAHCLDSTTVNVRELRRAARAEFKEHAQTVKAHRRYMKRWESKVSSGLMRFTRLGVLISTKMLPPLTAIASKQRPNNLPEDWVAVDHNKAGQLVNVLSNLSQELLKKPGTIPSYEDFLERSSNSRSERLTNLIEDGDPTLAALLSILRVGDYPALTDVRKRVNSAIFKDLTDRFTPEVIRANQRVLERSNLDDHVNRSIQIVQTDVFTSVAGAVKERLTDDGDGYTVAQFVNDVVVRATDKAFTDADKRSSVVTKVDEVVDGFIKQAEDALKNANVK